MSAIDLGMALLPAVSADFHHGDAFGANFYERVLDFLQLVRLNHMPLADMPPGRPMDEMTYSG